MELTLLDADFERLTVFIKNNYGINLAQKRQLVASRLGSTVTDQGFGDFSGYINHILKTKKTADIENIINKLTTNYTFFMREKQHYDFFRNVVLPDLIERHQRDKVISIWSAGCSSGEEPYNISMYIKDFLGTKAKDWDTRVLATDICQQVLEKAKEGKYELPDTIPSNWQTKYFVPTKDPKVFEVAPDIKKNVIFQTFNLMDNIRFKLKFDIIFCRNVMIYFDQPTKDALCQRYYDATTPGGYLFIGHSESLNKNTPYKTLAPATYQKANK
ncbi:MAG: protein-glutamate O-methyltransferase CheR [Eubacteriales bacterium]